jgi:UDP-N-acetylglucosamine 4-epimerase
MTRYEDTCASLRAAPRTWLVTGAAGFIGSHLVESLLALGQRVVGLDNLATGKRENVAAAERAGVDAQTTPGGAFAFVEADINDREAVDHALRGALQGPPVDFVLHQAALGSVPRSIKDPLTSHRANVDGFLQVLLAARDAGVRRFVYASSSSVYGDHPDLPKVEDRIGQALSPYAATKRINEIYAHTFQVNYQMECTGLRYFNVFGPRQDKDGAYAAVIPLWVGRLLRGERCVINGDGETSRDFCYVKTAVQANLLAATGPSSSTDRVYNVACGARTDLRALFASIRDGLAALEPDASRRAALLAQVPEHGPFRAGDVRHSLADVALAREHLGYEPSHDVHAGLAEALRWYRETA